MRLFDEVVAHETIGTYTPDRQIVHGVLYEADDADVIMEL